MVTRSAERGEHVTARWGVPTFRIAEELLAAGPQDHLISVAIGESAQSGRDVTTEREAWAR